MQLSETFEQMDAYLERSFLRPDPVLEAIAENSEKEGLVPHAVTPLQAEFLAFLIRITGARRVLEIGCLGGYSAVAMARALPADGHLLTTEIDTRTAKVAQANIEQSGFGDRIDLQVGPAMQVLEREQARGTAFDLVFIDADKVNHKNYLERALTMARPGTVITATCIRATCTLSVKRSWAYLTLITCRWQARVRDLGDAMIFFADRSRPYNTDDIHSLVQPFTLNKARCDEVLEAYDPLTGDERAALPWVIRSRVLQMKLRAIRKVPDNQKLAIVFDGLFETLNQLTHV